MSGTAVDAFLIAFRSMGHALKTVKQEMEKGIKAHLEGARKIREQELDVRAFAEKQRTKRKQVRP